MYVHEHVTENVQQQPQIAGWDESESLSLTIEHMVSEIIIDLFSSMLFTKKQNIL